MTSATEELRRLLDERGVEWFGSYDSDETSWDVGELTWVYGNDGNIAGLGVVQGDITPEQAIASTLGRGTCHDVWQDDPFANFKCSECNEELHYRDKKRVACCPFCKREVVSA